MCFNNNGNDNNNEDSNFETTSQSNRNMETFSINSGHIHCLNPFSKCTNIIRRRLYWHLIAKGEGFKKSYEEFKPT
jgi:hypothetical protein